MGLRIVFDHLQSFEFSKIFPFGGSLLEKKEKVKKNLRLNPLVYGNIASLNSMTFFEEAEKHCRFLERRQDGVEKIV